MYINLEENTLLVLAANKANVVYVTQAVEANVLYVYLHMYTAQEKFTSFKSCHGRKRALCVHVFVQLLICGQVRTMNTRNH